MPRKPRPNRTSPGDIGNPVGIYIGALVLEFAVDIGIKNGIFINIGFNIEIFNIGIKISDLYIDINIDNGTGILEYW